MTEIKEEEEEEENFSNIWYLLVSLIGRDTFGDNSFGCRRWTTRL